MSKSNYTARALSQMQKGASLNRERVSGIPSVPNDVSVETRQFLDAIKDVVETQHGDRGEGLDSALTWRDLLRVGIVEASSMGGAGGSSVGAAVSSVKGTGGVKKIEYSSYTKADLLEDLAEGVGAVLAGVGSDYVMVIDDASAYIALGHKDAVYSGYSSVADTSNARLPGIVITAAGIGMGFNDIDGNWVNSFSLLSSTGTATFYGDINTLGDGYFYGNNNRSVQIDIESVLVETDYSVYGDGASDTAANMVRVGVLGTASAGTALYNVGVIGKGENSPEEDNGIGGYFFGDTFGVVAQSDGIYAALQASANGSGYAISATSTGTIAIESNKAIRSSTKGYFAQGIDKLTTASGAVDVSGASAPSIGYGLVATSATTANWQAISLANHTHLGLTSALEPVAHNSEILFDANGDCLMVAKAY